MIITNHQVYDYQAIVEASTAVFDSRNATRSVEQGIDKVVEL